MPRVSLSWALILGLLSGIGPLCTDFYLPALPEITQQLQATSTQTQLSLTAALIGLGLGQLFFGPLSDRIGRLKPLALSLLLFIFSSAMCALTRDINMLIVWRFLQGFAGAGGSVLSRSIARDKYQGTLLTQFFALLMTVNGIAPVLSPVLGGWVVEATSWRWVFYANLPLALIALILTQCWVRPVTQSARPAPVRLATLAHLLKSPLLRVAMLTYLCIPGIFMGTQLVSILYVHQLGYGPAQTGALMLPWALASALGIALSRYRFNRWGPKPLLLAGMSAQALGIALLILLQDGPLWLPMALYALMGFGGSLCSSTAQNTAFIDVPADHMAPASALWNLNRQLSFLLGPALMMGLFSALSSITSTSHAFALCFAIGAGMTLVPLIPALRLNTPRVLALLAP